MVVLKN